MNTSNFGNRLLHNQRLQCLI